MRDSTATTLLFTLIPIQLRMACRQLRLYKTSRTAIQGAIETQAAATSS